MGLITLLTNTLASCRYRFAGQRRDESRYEAGSAKASMVDADVGSSIAWIT
jgi:hypothetical protein